MQFREFTSTEDGQHFIQRLEGIPDDILGRLPNSPRPSQIDTLLAIIRRDAKATVYVNEVNQIARVRVSGAVEKGSPIFKSDIVDISDLELDVAIPETAGVLFLFSVRWRKGLFFDFGPISGPEPQPRDYNFASVIGQCYCQVMFQERFSISDSEWNTLLAAKWFPFTGLGHNLIEKMVDYVRAGWEPDELVDEFATTIKGRLPQILDAWRSHACLSPHFPILDRAVERFMNDDFVSCTGLLFPRIEGIMRTQHSTIGNATNATQSNLSATVVSSKIENAKCLLLPHRFTEYLRSVYFASFNPIAQAIDISRNSVGHGVADPAQFNKKSAIIGILVVHQLFYFMDGMTDSPADGTATQSDSPIPLKAPI